MTLLVALTGLPRTGKDTIASHLVVQYGFTRFAFATKLYEEVAESFSVTVEQLQSDDWKKNPKDFLAIWHSNDPEYRQRMMAMGYDLVEPRTSRFHTQQWGTEYRRASDGLYWVKLLQPQLEAVDGTIVISDLRENAIEYPFLRQFASATDREFRCIQVDRTGIVRSPHASDNGINPHNVDYYVHNPENDPFTMLEDLEAYLIPLLKGTTYAACKS